MNKKVKAYRIEFKKRNAKFREKGPVGKRTAIARDVIEQVDKMSYFPASMYFGGSGNFEKTTNVGRDMGECLAEDDFSCSVCGIGSLFVSAIRHDKFKVTKGILGHTAHDLRSIQTEYLGKWFTQDQLDLIEVYFELGRTINGWGRKPKPYSPICSERAAQRLKMIMENIISNRGTFDPLRGSHRVTAAGSQQAWY